ncbi:RlmE family RNA methyltransferase, partial [Patescibacteria group bacterium]|nr:RlmE family RNA methyltransferase [Patescibacteria group bacterium]
MENNPYTNDFYAQEAKRHGLRARSVFKLLEIQKKYKIAKKGDAILDLGAAPGSFLEFLSKIVGPQGSVVGVDLKTIKPFKRSNIVLVQGDIMDPKLGLQD